MGKYPYQWGPKFAANTQTQMWRYPKHGRKLYPYHYIRDIRFDSFLKRCWFKHLMITVAMVIEYASNTHRDRSLSQSILSPLESDTRYKAVAKLPRRVRRQRQARERLRFDPLRRTGVACSRLSPSNKFDWNDSLSKNRKPTISCEQRYRPDVAGG